MVGIVATNVYTDQYGSVRSSRPSQLIFGLKDAQFFAVVQMMGVSYYLSRPDPDKHPKDPQYCMQSRPVNPSISAHCHIVRMIRLFAIGLNE